MPSSTMVAQIAALTGDPVRAGMLNALMDGGAMPATELARIAGVTASTASGHLNRMTALGLLAVEKQGRYRYHRIATPSVARMVESIMQVAAELESAAPKRSMSPGDAALRRARICYDHLAGRLGVAVADALVARRHIELTGDAGLLTESGVAFFGDLGIDLEGRRIRRPSHILCRACLDWSEGRLHLAGSVGTMLCAHSLREGWARRIPGTAALRITPRGERVFREKVGVRFDQDQA
jgi:DNA-binding transcriptional ArsR family regulator